MPLTTTTSVDNADPASVTVTVTETTGPGGDHATVDVLFVIDLTFANPGRQTHDPVGYEVSAPPSTVRWRAQALAPGDEKTYTVVLDHSASSEAVCGAVTTVVTGVVAGVPYYDMQAPVVCFV